MVAFDMNNIRGGGPPKMQEPVEMSGARERRPKTAPAPRPSSASLKKQISGALMTINLALIMIPPLRRDVMDMVEIDALATALDDQAKQSKRFRQALETALSATTGGNLVGILAIVGARRAARHGMIPEEADQMLGNLLAQGMDAERTVRAAAAA